MPRKYHYSSNIDYMASQLSEKTGSIFSVRRERKRIRPNPHGFLAGADLQEWGPLRYQLVGTLDDESYTFQTVRLMTNQEMKRLLASLLALIIMEFIPVDTTRVALRQTNRKRKA